MKDKAVFILNIGNYFPELTQLTKPLIEAYAKKIDADLIEIKERKFEGHIPCTYEKLQVHELGMHYDWCIFTDLDNIILPGTIDFTKILDPKYVGAFDAFDADKQFAKDEYFIRDDRNIGVSSRFLVTSKLTHDLWQPCEWINWGCIKREFIVDEYIISRNLAKYGLKFTGLDFLNNKMSQVFHLNVNTEERSKDLILEEAKKYLKENGGL